MPRERGRFEFFLEERWHKVGASGDTAVAFPVSRDKVVLFAANAVNDGAIIIIASISVGYRTLESFYISVTNVKVGYCATICFREPGCFRTVTIWALNRMVTEPFEQDLLKFS